MTEHPKIPVLDKGYVRLIEVWGSDREIVRSARVSYDGDTVPRTADEDRKLLNYLYRNQHATPFEMAGMRFEVKLPIFVARQWMRHRTLSYNEVSARYTELPDEYYVPESWRMQDTKNKQGSVPSPELDAKGLSAAYSDMCHASFTAYKLLLDAGVAREMARMVLPVSTYTRMIVGAKVRNLLHFLSLRDDAHAQMEIREYAEVLTAMLKDHFPWTYNAYRRYKFQFIDTTTVS